MPSAPSTYTTAPATSGSSKIYDRVEMLLGLGEGPIKGLKDGAKSFYFGNTPLMSPDGTTNFSDVTVQIFNGDPAPDNVQMALGGLSSSTDVNVVGYSNQPILRTTSTGQIDVIEVRLALTACYRDHSDGPGNQYLHYRIEYKAHSSSTWLAFAGNKDKTFVGVITKPTPYEYRQTVKRIDEPYDIRVTKTSPESSSKDHFELSFESFQEVTNGPC